MHVLLSIHMHLEQGCSKLFQGGVAEIYILQTVVNWRFHIEDIPTQFQCQQTEVFVSDMHEMFVH